MIDASCTKPATDNKVFQGPIKERFPVSTTITAKKHEKKDSRSLSRITKVI